jgi:hypothetical protein
VSEIRIRKKKIKLVNHKGNPSAPIYYEYDRSPSVLHTAQASKSYFSETLVKDPFNIGNLHVNKNSLLISY